MGRGLRIPAVLGMVTTLLERTGLRWEARRPGLVTLPQDSLQRSWCDPDDYTHFVHESRRSLACFGMRTWQAMPWRAAGARQRQRAALVWGARIIRPLRLSSSHVMIAAS